MPGTVLADELIAAYRRANYIITTGLQESVLRVDQYSRVLDDLHNQHQAKSSAIITACNPYGDLRSTRDNETATDRLEHQLTRDGFILYACRARDPQGRWPDEPGYLVIGVTTPQAWQLGNDFHQNAILCCGTDAVPRLVLLR